VINFNLIVGVSSQFWSNSSQSSGKSIPTPSNQNSLIICSKCWPYFVHGRQAPNEPHWVVYIYPMTFLLTFVATLSLSFAVGHLVARAAKLPRNYQALKPALGMATILITSSLAYRIGLNENAISLSTWTIGIIGSIILDRKAIASGFSHFKISFMFLR
jgi:hypothetical protein